MADVDGDWLMTVDTPMGPQVSTLSLKADGDRLTGQVKGAMGVLPLEAGRIDGDRLSWTINATIPFPMALEAEATVAGDAISGGVKAGAFGTSPMSAVRKS